MDEPSPSKERRSPSSSPDPLALTSSAPRSRGENRSRSGSVSGNSTRARQRGLSRASRASNRSGTRSPRGSDAAPSLIRRPSQSVRNTNQLDEEDSLSAGLPRSSRRKESLEISAPTALIRSDSDGSLSPSNDARTPRPPTEMSGQGNLHTFQHGQETASDTLIPAGSPEVHPAISPVPDTANPLHMLAFAAQETSGGKASDLARETAELEDEDPDAEGDTDIEDHDNGIRPIQQPSPEVLLGYNKNQISVPPNKLAMLPPAETSETPLLAQTDDTEAKRRSPGEVQVLPSLDSGILSPSTTDIEAQKDQTILGGPSMNLSSLSEARGQTQGDASDPPQSTRLQTDTSDPGSLVEMSPNITTESATRDRVPSPVGHGIYRRFDNETKSPVQVEITADPITDQMVSTGRISPAPETDVAPDEQSLRIRSLAAGMPSGAPNAVLSADIDMPEKLQFMGAMGDRSLQRHLREMEKAAIAQKKSEAAASSSAASMPTTEANKRRKLAPKPNNVNVSAKLIKEELEVDGDIWKALASDEAREKESRTTPTTQGKSKPKGKTGKSKKQQLEQAETSQHLLVSTDDFMDVDSDPTGGQEEPREKKKANKRGARFASPAASVSTTASNKKSRDQAAVDAQHTVEEGDDGVWCICKEPYDENRVMILCDGICNNWYHIECVGLDPLLVPLVNIFICPVCQKDPSVLWTTTYQEKCLRELCRQPRRQPLSKYCSQACGFHHMAAAMQIRHLQASDIAPFVLQAEQPEAYILDHTSATMPTRIECAASAKRKRHLQAENARTLLVSRQASLTQKLNAIKQQQARLETAVQTAEDLADIQPAVEDASESTKKKGKKMSKTKQRSTADDNRPCGFNAKLLCFDPHLQGNSDTVTNDDTNDTDDICLEAKRKCARHSGWQKLRSVALELEHNSLNEEIQILGTRMQAFS